MKAVGTTPQIALACGKGNLPKLRIFQVMKQEGHVLYFATSAKKRSIRRYAKTQM